MEAVLGIIAFISFYAAVAVAGRLKMLRTGKMGWFVVMGLAPLWVFPLGFLSPVLWGFCVCAVIAHALITARSELKMRRAFLARIEEAAAA